MRKVDYLRISVTDRCNEICTYCMPEGFRDWQPKNRILTYEEILRAARVAVDLGFRRFRITGGEPLLRRGLPEFIGQLTSIPGVASVSMTTNALLLAPQAARLAEAGLCSVNISLDSVDPETYRKLTGGRLEGCLEGVFTARTTEGLSVKLNTVLFRGVNDDILPLARFAAELDVPIRFIELMPITTSQVLTPESFLSAVEARNRLSEKLALKPFPKEDARWGWGPAAYFSLHWDPRTWRRVGDEVQARLPGLWSAGETPRSSVVGFISPMTDGHFCESCNKLRITPEGMLRPCLGNHLEFDLRSVMRNGGADEELRRVFLTALRRKPEHHDFQAYDPRRHMSAIGG